jgi:hypothetical protein
MSDMSEDETFRTKCMYLEGVDYIFLSLDRSLTGEECKELAEKYFESHHQPLTSPRQALIVDLRPAFRKPLSDVTPKFERAPES